jgi:hypothetical protein
VWRLAKLQSYRFTVYAQDVSQVESSIAITVSYDGQTWIDLPYTTTVETSEGKYKKLNLESVVPAGMDAEFVRVRFKTGVEPSDAVQLGHVYLIGRRLI